MSNAADDLWDEIEDSSPDTDDENPKEPDPSQPWAKTSSGDSDNFSSN
jgi:hypothetical protein